MENIRQYLLLRSIKHVGDTAVIKLLDKFSTLEQVFNKNIEELGSAKLSQRQAEAIFKKDFDENSVDKELELIEKHKINIILYESESFPILLKQISSAPALLYQYGNIDVLNKPSIGIVGARKASMAAKELTKKLSRDLAESGFNIVSGFASGIDISAHTSAIEKGTTTAVLGNGILNIYPQSNRKYLKKIIDNGSIITEFSMNTMPDAHNFPRRNRIISGLSYGTVIIEAAPKSGSLITAKYALEQNREVFAVPAWPGNFQNATNKLIKDGAILVENYLDIVEALSHLLAPMKVVDKESNDNNITFDSEIRNRIYSHLTISAQNIDDLLSEIDLPIEQLMVELAEMEMEDYISLDIDGKYSIKNYPSKID